MTGLALAGCILLDAPYKHDFGTVPEPLDDGWAVGTPEDVGLDPRVLDRIHAELLREDRFFGTLGVLVAKDGVLVFETYLRDPADRDRLHSLQSATKSVTSTLVGIGRDQGLVPDLDTPVCDLLRDACAGVGARKRDITLEHLLTMRSGLDLSNDQMAYRLTVTPPDDPLRYLLDLPLYADPGDAFYYRDVDPQLMSYALEALAGRTEAAFAREHLFAPLGITDHHWIALVDGSSTGAFGLYLRPRDFAKLGQVGLDGGRWHDTRVVSEDWLALATAPAEPDAWEGWDYGYNWWISPGGDAITASGHGGQLAMWVPDAGILAVQVALPDAALHGDSPQDFYDLVRPLWEGE
jgi:CubicO group peptidase (beta-lactamase class C family)